MKSPKPPSKMGRKPKLTDRIITSLIRKARTGSYSARELTSIAHNDFEVDIGVRRVQQITSDAPFMKYLKMLTAPRMSPDNKKDRVDWALKYIKKYLDFWSSVIFSDENRFCLDGPDGNCHYWADTRMDRRSFSTRSRGG